MENSLAKMRPDLCLQWDMERNQGCSPDDVSYRSAKIVWWTCQRNHHWQAAINVRTRTQSIEKGCPYCNNRKANEENCLATLNPELAKQWDRERNYPLTPNDVVPGSRKTVYWVCEKGHVTQARICDRNKGAKCGVCVNVKIDESNNLATINPRLAKEWNQKRNAPLTPNNVTPGSAKRVWWRCEKGHEWESPVRVRVGGSRCPYCLFFSGLLMEQSIYFYLTESFGSVLTDYKCLIGGKKRVVDFYLLEQMVAIECKACGKNKNELRITITLYEGLENDKPKLTRISDDNLDSVIEKTLNYLKENYKSSGELKYVNHKKDDLLIRNINLKEIKKEKLFLDEPLLEIYWNEEKNRQLDNILIRLDSSDMFWWKCKEKHEWQATLLTLKEEVHSPYHGCPYCSGQIVDSTTQLDLIYPETIKLWNYNRNNVSPNQVSIFSRKLYWFICPEGHEWKWSANRIAKLRQISCPTCRREQEKLSIKRPDLVVQWDWEQNNLLPSEVTIHSTQKIWWKCQKGHHFYMTVIHRTRGNHAKCPICDKIERCLFTHVPALLEEWHPTKNEGVSTENVTYQSNRLYWWMCKKGHEWEAIAFNRLKGQGCPYCANRRVALESSLEALNPTLAEEWHPTRNLLLPSQVTPGSSKKVFWRCERGHEWEATVNDRNRGKGCPYCSGQKVVYEQSIAKLNPELMREWDYQQNLDVNPREISPSSSKVVGWCCKHQHHWRASIKERNKGKGCPMCDLS